MEEELRSFIKNLLAKHSKQQAIEWAFGAAAFACDAALISVNVRDQIQSEFELMD